MSVWDPFNDIEYDGEENEGEGQEEKDDLDGINADLDTTDLFDGAQLASASGEEEEVSDLDLFWGR